MREKNEAQTLAGKIRRCRTERRRKTKEKGRD